MSKWWVRKDKWWPITIHFQRCPAFFGKKCNKLFWPWQEIISVDPECFSPRHHSCYHKEIKYLYHDYPISEGEEPQDWKNELWCEHESNEEQNNNE